jgi:hypothetical protein
MTECEQTKGQSVLEHGISVKNYLFDLINHLRSNTPLKYEWNLPDWVLENKDLLLSSLPDDETLELYTIYHDCGKPFCLETDENVKDISQIMRKFLIKFLTKYLIIQLHQI